MRDEPAAVETEDEGSWTGDVLRSRIIMSPLQCIARTRTEESPQELLQGGEVRKSIVMM